MCQNSPSNRSVPYEGFIPVNHAEIYFRQIGQGQPIVILHGGPDFDHTYLLPELDRLSDSFQLIYYDQRGRGKSANHVQPADVTIQSDVADIESLRRYFRLETMAVLGHSWGGLLALEYALNHSDRVSHLILMNTAPVSKADYLLFRQFRSQRAPVDIEKLQARSSDIRYQQGDPDTVAEYYRIHFKKALRRHEHLESVIKRLRSSFTQEGILKAREIEIRLMNATWLSSEYDLHPRLERLRIPALILHGEDDIIPLECAAHIAQALPGARLVLLRECGHFAYLEHPLEFCKEMAAFFQGS